MLVGRVIVGACGSPGSIRALRYARQIAESSDALLIPVHAWLPPGGDMADRRAPNPLLRKVWQEAAQQRLTESIESAWGGVPDGVAVMPTVVRGSAGDVLVQLADRLDDVIVIGAGRRGVLARIGHAGTSRFCLARAKCPVIAVPPSALARYAGRWPLALAFRHHGLNADEALDGVDQQ
ncbi:MAG TPA: universal stress protein [Streptosporangiaceae bacterium]|nr:universal stress protein [Streptosporangiaceae bacterium]